MKCTNFNEISVELKKKEILFNIGIINKSLLLIYIYIYIIRFLFLLV